MTLLPRGNLAARDAAATRLPIGVDERRSNQRQLEGSSTRSTHTPSSHCRVDVHVFCATTDPLSVRQPLLGSMPLLQLEGSLVRATHWPSLHCRVSVHVLFV
jgi:hypothetical protein